MTLELRFGQGGAPGQWYLPGTDPTALPQPRPTPPVGDALITPPFDPFWDWQGGTLLFGGLVSVRAPEYLYRIQPGFDVTGGWNSVKNAFARSDGPIPADLFFSGFVHVDVTVTANVPGSDGLPGGAIIDISGAKRGNVDTADADDLIIIRMLSNEPTWNNEFRIASGGGDDTVELSGLRRAADQAATPDPTYDNFVGTDGTWNTSGTWTSTFTDLGPGEDRFQGFGSADSVTGGEGNDTARGGEGHDTWQLAGTADGYRITTNGTDTHITDIDPADGDDGTDDLRGFEEVRFGDGTTQALPEAEGLAPVRLADIAAGLGGFKLVGLERSRSWDETVQVAAPGDLNGDGLADLVVTDPLYPYGPGLGVTYVVYGKADGAAVDLAALPEAGSAAGFSIVGTESVPVTDVAAAGDVNGDGLADLLVGSLGGAYVVFGGGTGPIDLSAIGAGGSSQGFGITGLAAFNPTLVAGAGDVNGDGLADLLVGDPYPDDGTGGEINAGYVVFGKADGAGVAVGDIDGGLGAQGFAVRAAPSPGYFYRNDLTGAGDVNGDGLADLLLTSYAYLGTGAPAGLVAHVVFGKRDSAAVALAEVAAGTGTQGFRINADPDPSLSAYGLAPAAAGDVNGDGLDDVVLGTIQNDEPAVLGAAFVVFGKADSEQVDLADVSAGIGTTGFRVLGQGQGDLTGRQVSAAGDLNGDGLGDLMVGVPRGGNVANVVFGKPDGAPANLYGIDASPSSQMFGIADESTLWRTHTAVAAAGDVNGDGLPDLLVADPTEGGGAYVIFGRQGWRDGTTTGANAAAAAPPDWAEALELRFSNGSVGRGQAPAPPEVSEGIGFSTITLYETNEGVPILADVIEATGAWNSVKNLETGPDAWNEALGPYLVVSNFVDVRMDFSNTPPDPEDEVGLDLVVHGVKRGEVTFGDGNANASIHFHSNEASWNNTFTVHAGTGRTDVVGWLAKSALAPVTGLLADNADPTNGEFWNPNYDGRYSRLEVFGGDGITIAAVEQRVTLVAHGGRGLDVMYGADGDDILDGGGGYDLYTGGGGQDEFILHAGEVDGDQIMDFDGVGAAAGDMIRLLGFAPGTIVVDISQNDQSDATYGIYVPPYESEYLVGYFTAPKGLVVGQDIVFG